MSGLSRTNSTSSVTSSSSDSSWNQSSIPLNLTKPGDAKTWGDKNWGDPKLLEQFKTKEIQARKFLDVFKDNLTPQSASVSDKRLEKIKNKPEKIAALLSQLASGEAAKKLMKIDKNQRVSILTKMPPHKAAGIICSENYMSCQEDNSTAFDNVFFYLDEDSKKTLIKEIVYQNSGMKNVLAENKDFFKNMFAGTAKKMFDLLPESNQESGPVNKNSFKELLKTSENNNALKQLGVEE